MEEKSIDQKDIWIDRLNTPKKPWALKIRGEYEARCPTCLRRIYAVYDESRDQWFYPERCECGQLILDDQKN